MKYLTGTPAAAPLRSCILLYGEIAEEGIVSKSITPRPGATLAIILAGSCRVNGRPVPQAAVFGIRERSVFLETGPRQGHRIQVQFNSWGLGRFITASAACGAGKVSPACGLFPTGSVESLERLLSSAGTSCSL